VGTGCNLGGGEGGREKRPRARTEDGGVPGEVEEEEEEGMRAATLGGATWTGPDVFGGGLGGGCASAVVLGVIASYPLPLLHWYCWLEREGAPRAAAESAPLVPGQDYLHRSRPPAVRQH